MSRSILLAEIMHETNTFNTIPTTRRDFETRYWLEGDDIPVRLKDTNTEVCGFLDAAVERGWTVVHPLAASTSPSGPMATQDWSRVVDLITAPLLDQTFDAVVLALHGSMVTETTLDAEGELLTKVRELAGTGTVIAVTLDMHANVSPEMVANANIMMAYRTYPHIDQYERAQHLARLLDEVFDTGTVPCLHIARRPMMDAANHGQTADGQPMLGLLAKAAELETDAGVSCASIQIGFPWADVPDQGPSVLITGTDPVKCQTAAENLMDEVWQSRLQTDLVFPAQDEAMALAGKGMPGAAPLVLADFADNPAGGAYG
ncbi:MAG: M81 family metallopeptidase, partial [Aestuariivirgaceae bacterium]